MVRWGSDAAALAPRANVWHAHDLTAMPAAIEARRRHGGQIVYDSHELFLESGTHIAHASWARRLLARLERRWANQAAAVVAVNDAIGGELVRRYGLRRIVVVDNCPPRWRPPAVRVDRLRETLGLPPTTPIALYHGRFAPHRGLEQLADAILEPGLEHVHAVYLGYGQSEPVVEGFRADPRFGGRVHLVPAVAPEVLLEWLATADLEVMAIQPSTLNHRLATGNKLFEALAVGVPVVASDHPGKRLVVQGIGDGPLGELCDPTDVRDVARAMRAILSLSDDDRSALRARCLRAANERWNWEVESAKLVALYEEIQGATPSRA
jgi:glycosyltransferase involved in cell wall biosynthesis